MTNRKGRFIVIEGMDGSGKSTMVSRLKDWLIENNQSGFASDIRDPGSTPLGEELRNILKGYKTGDVHFMGELLMFLAARTQLCAERIIPSLANGVDIVCDRFTPSTIAYQWWGRELHKMAHPSGGNWTWKDFQRLIEPAELIKPDLVIYLDISATKSMERVRLRGTNMDKFKEQTQPFFDRVHNGYAWCMDHYSGRASRVDAAKPVDEVFSAVTSAVLARLGK